MWRASSTLAFIALTATRLDAQQPQTPRQRDRGPGQPTSMFGTYIQKGELLVYPFFESYVDRNFEYKPAELGYGVEQDFRGRYRATEGLIFLAYGITDRLALELEAAVISARLEKSPDDASTMPAVIEESGTGDVEGQLRMRWADETASRPEIFSYLELVSPQQRTKKLIGTADWEFKFGSGLARSTSLGTFTVRVAMEYEKAERVLGLGEYAVEYVRRLSPRFRIYTGVEGTQDEVAWIGELQVRLSRFATLKLNSAFGVTSKATDWAPEAGIVFSFPLRE